MDAAVAQLAVVHVDLLGTLTGYLGDTGNGLALLLALLNFLQHGIGHLGVAVQVVVNLGLDEVAHKLVEAAATGLHGGRAQLHLGLALKHRLLHIDGDGTHDTVADIGEFVVFVIKLLDGAGNMLLEGALVGTALRGVLTIDKGVVLLIILVGMGEGNLYVLGLEVYDGIEELYFLFCYI